MIADNINHLLILIAIVLVLLGICVSVDYADTTISNMNQTNVNLTAQNLTKINGSYYYMSNKTAPIINAKSSDKLHNNYPTISMWAKPSCGCRYSYTWHKYTFINYCPHCHRYGTLSKNPKGTYEGEYTCRYDDCDYCAVCGKEKYSWSRYYLTRA